MPQVEAFRAWLRQGPVGSKYLYHTGFLAPDRYRLFFKEGEWLSRTVEPTHTIGRMALNLSKNGKLHLFQQKLGPGRFAYIAVKREKIRI